MNGLDDTILETIVACKFGITRGSLKSILKIPRTTLYDHLKGLETLGYIKRVPISVGKQGRPKIKWQVKKS